MNKKNILSFIFLVIQCLGGELMSKPHKMEIEIKPELSKKIKKEQVEDFIQKFGDAMAEKNHAKFFALLDNSGRNAGIEHWYGFIPKKKLKKDFEKYAKMKEDDIEKLTKKLRFVEDLGNIPVNSSADLYLNLFSDKERLRIEQRVDWNNKEPFRFFSPSYLFTRETKCEVKVFTRIEEKVFPGIILDVSFEKKSPIFFRVNPKNFNIIAISWGEKLP